MKKTLIVFAAIIIGIYVVLSLADRGEYAVEKRMWRLGKKFRDIAQDPKAVPERQFEDVAAKYRNLAKKYPKSGIAPAILLQVGQVYMLKEDYPKARSAFEAAAKKYPDNQELRAAAFLGIAEAYAAEKNDAQALVTYRKIMGDYPFTDIGLNMPIYIANFHLRWDRKAEADAALLFAESYYQKIAKENTETPIRFNAQRLLAVTYLAEKKWDNALDTFEAILLEYARSPYLNWRRAELLIISINRIAIAQLKDINRAAGIYHKFIEQNPGHPLNKPLQAMIDSFKEGGNRRLPESK